jgi:hypothetical protein
MLWALMPPMAAVPKRSPSTRGKLWLAPLRWWMDRNRYREALAALADDEVSELSDLGRQVRRDARRAYCHCSQTRSLGSLPRANSPMLPYPAKAGILRRLPAAAIEARRRRAEREVARYLARRNNGAG